MITSNIDLADRLINGQFGIVFDFTYIDSSITKEFRRSKCRQKCNVERLV